jgi:hypothetical protein
MSGSKAWFMYPPGFHLDDQTQLRWNPYRAIDLWTVENIALVDSHTLTASTSYEHSDSPWTIEQNKVREKAIPEEVYRPSVEEMDMSATHCSSAEDSNTCSDAEGIRYLSPVSGSPGYDGDAGLEEGARFSALWFVQMAGDAVYVPHGWSHMTLNIHPYEPSGEAIECYSAFKG